MGGRILNQTRQSHRRVRVTSHVCPDDPERPGQDDSSCDPVLWIEDYRKGYEIRSICKLECIAEPHQPLSLWRQSDVS